VAKRDIIIACFSKPGGDPEKDAIAKMVYGSAWKEAPYVWSFPDDPSFPGDIRSEGYTSSARQLVAEAKGGPLIPLILNKINKSAGITEFGRVALVTFSAGNSAARFIMQSPADQQLLDTFISLDSTAFMKDPSGQPFRVAKEGLGYYQYPTFGLQGLDASAMSIYLHTSIINANPNIMSTKASAELIFDELRAIRTSMDDPKVRDKSIPSPLDFNPGYYYGSLNAGPRTKYWPVGYEGVHVMDRIGNNFRLWLKTNSETQINGHIACCYDFQRGIYDTFLKPRWNQPEDYSCLGPECIKQFSPDPPLSGLGRGLGALGYTETVEVPKTKSVDMDALHATWAAMGLPRWDLAYKAGALALGAGLAAAVTYCFLSPSLSFRRLGPLSPDGSAHGCSWRRLVRAVERLRGSVRGDGRRDRRARRRERPLRRADERPAAAARARPQQRAH